jgi:hypothetical protein
LLATYKIIAKTLANRLQPLLPSYILPTQTEFVKNRCILDKILLAIEAIEWAKESQQDIVLLLLDFERAYDRVNCVRCSAIEGISHWYHRCGPVCMLRSRVNIEEVAYKWHLGYLGAIGLLKPMRDRLIPHLGTSSLLSLYVDVWRLIF